MNGKIKVKLVRVGAARRLLRAAVWALIWRPARCSR